MQFTVDSAINGSEEVKEAEYYPNIRVFTIGTKTKSTTPLKELADIEQPWVMASPSSIGVGNWSAFSAVCWFFGRNLYDQLKVPIGLLSDNWGGTVIQTWTSTQGLSKCKQPPSPTVDESLLWNSMIVPILPMSISGAIWYQGESNADYADYYACAFPAMIIDWRSHWSGDTDPQFPFLFVQLAPWIKSGTKDGNAAEASIRLSQMCATKLPNTGYATAADLGEPLSPFGSGHPRLKQLVGYRLSLASRKIIYNEPVQYKGPEAMSFTVLSDGPAARVQVDFVADSIGSGLVLQPKTCEPNVSSLCSEFEVGGTDGSWSPAEVILDTNSVVISSTLSGNMKVTGVRYGWSSYPLMTLYNQEGLPAIPFALPNPIICV